VDSSISSVFVRRGARRRTLAIGVVVMVAIATIAGSSIALAQTGGEVTVTTEVHDPDHNAGPFDLGSLIHDFVEVMTGDGRDIPGGSSVSFEFYTDECSTLLPPVSGVEFGPDPLSSPVSAESSARGPLHAGDYAWRAVFTSGLSGPVSGAVSDGVSACEPFEVNKADTTTTTAFSPPMSVIDLFGDVQDTATVDTAGYDGFDLGPADVTFTIYDNWTCDGNVVGSPEDVGISGTPPQTVLSSETTLTPGFYSYQAVYEGNSDYNGSTSPCEPFTVIPTITRGSCSFDLYEDPGQQFRLIYTPIPYTTYYRLAASNPGQFFYNVVVSGASGDPFSVDVEFPYPWVTMGDVPTHMWDDVNFHMADGKWCVGPSGNGIGSDSDQILFGNYDWGTVDSQTLTVDGTIGPNGFTFFRVHMDFGLKHSQQWQQIKLGNTAHPISPLDAPDITSPMDWLFSDSTGGGADLQSINVFKRDPAIGGLVTYAATGDPVVGTNVRIYDVKNVLKANLYTDADGWYYWAMKFSGKTVTWTVKLPSFNLSQTISGPSKTFYVVNFAV